MNGFLDNAIAWVENSLPQILQKGVAAVENFISGWGSGDGHMMKTVGELIGKIFTIIIKAIPQIQAAGTTIIMKLALGFIQNTPYFLTQIGKLLGQVVSTIASNLPRLFSSGGSMIGKIISGFLNGIVGIPSAVKQAIEKFKTNFQNTDWKSLGTNIIKGIVKGITGSLGSIASAAKNAAKHALNTAKKTLGIHSPSRMFETEVGKMIDLGLAAGIENNIKPVQTSMRTLSMETVGMIDTSGIISDSSNASFAPAQTQSNTSVLETILQLLSQYLPSCADSQIVLDNGALVAGIAPEMDRALYKLQNSRNRGR